LQNFVIAEGLLPYGSYFFSGPSVVAPNIFVRIIVFV